MSDETEEHSGVQGVQGVQGIRGPQGVPGVDAIERAGNLTKALEENTDVLRKVLRRQRWQRLAIVLLFILSGVSAYLWERVGDTQDDLEAAQQIACESGNNVRQGLLNVADVLEAAGAQPRPDGRPRTAAEIAANREFVAGLRQDFALRDCEAS